MDRLKQILVDIESTIQANEQADCDFFAKASVELQETYYQAWLKAHATEEKPRFLKEYEETRKQT